MAPLPKISYLHHWINVEGMGHIESWKNSKTLICQSAHEELDEDEKGGKYSSVNRRLEFKFHTIKVKWESSLNINTDQVEDPLGYLMLKQKIVM